MTNAHMNKKKLVVMVVIFLLIFSLFIFIIKNDIFKKPEYFSYNQFTNEIEKSTIEDDWIILPEELEKSEGTTFVANNYIVRGYFDNFDKSNKTITLKAEIMNRKQYRMVETIITNETIMACWPETLYDNAGQNKIATYQLTFPLENKDDFLKIREEKIIESYDFSKLENSSYLIIQLVNSIDISMKNEIKKIILVGSC